MGIFEFLLIAVGLSMDAFAVSVCNGLKMKKFSSVYACIIALFFGVFQAAMPIIGFFLGKGFESQIKAFDHWIAFGLLAVIGINMIREALGKDDESVCACGGYTLNLKELTLMAVATSIDALAVGITFAVLEVPIFTAAPIIGIITFIISFGGVFLGNRFGASYKEKAELAGGIILVLIGTKILLEHLNIL